MGGHLSLAHQISTPFFREGALSSCHLQAAPRGMRLFGTGSGRVLIGDRSFSSPWLALTPPQRFAPAVGATPTLGDRSGGGGVARPASSVTVQDACGSVGPHTAWARYRHGGRFVSSCASGYYPLARPGASLLIQHDHVIIDPVVDRPQSPLYRVDLPRTIAGTLIEHFARPADFTCDK